MNFETNKIAFATSMSVGRDAGKANAFLARQLNRAQGKHEEAQLIFDSALQPVVPGVRGSAAVRQMLYKSGSLFIDMQIQPTPGSDSRVLIGQLHDSANPNHGIRGVPVSLLLENGT